MKILIFLLLIAAFEPGQDSSTPVVDWLGPGPDNISCCLTGTSDVFGLLLEPVTLHLLNLSAVHLLDFAMLNRTVVCITGPEVGADFLFHPLDFLEFQFKSFEVYYLYWCLHILPKPRFVHLRGGIVKRLSTCYRYVIIFRGDCLITKVLLLPYLAYLMYGGQPINYVFQLMADLVLCGDIGKFLYNLFSCQGITF